MKTWEELGIQQELQHSLTTQYAIQDPTEIQKLTIPAILQLHQTHNFVLQAQTGSGKTLAFCLPILQSILHFHRSGQSNQRQYGLQALILVPTKELANQIYTVLERLLRSSTSRIVVGLLNGSDKRKSEKARIRKGLNLVVATPGRILDHLENTQNFPLAHLDWIVLDEADRLLDLGFEQKIIKIVGILKEKKKLMNGKTNAEPNFKFILCSATITEGIRNILEKFSQLPTKIVAAKEEQAQLSAAPQQLSQKYLIVPTKLRFLALLALLRDSFKRDNIKIVCFLSCCDSVDFHFSALQSFSREIKKMDNPVDDSKSPAKRKMEGQFEQSKGLEQDSAAVLPTSSKAPFLDNSSIYRLHGNLEQSQRTKVMQEFRTNSKNCLLFCTDVAARGLDIPDVSLIIQYEAPSDTNDYIHRIGRTARIGKRGEAILFLTPEEQPYIEYLRGKMNGPITEVDILPLLYQLIGKTSPKINVKTIFKDPVDGPLSSSTTSLLSRLDDGPLKRGLSHIYCCLESMVTNDSSLHALSKNAFTSSVRAYATHQKDHREFFKLSQIHLGHYAKSFSLRDPPSNICRQMPRTSKNKPSTVNSRMPVKRSISEFDSGI